MKYQSKVTGIGELAFELLEVNDLLIIYNDNAPPELAELSVLHSIEEIKEKIKVGDTLQLGNQTYTITAVGDEAMHTLKELGHCTFKFSGKEKVEMPGEIELSGSSKPNVKIGDMIILK